MENLFLPYFQDPKHDRFAHEAFLSLQMDVFLEFISSKPEQMILY